MKKHTIKYSTASRAHPPRRIKLQVPGWGGDVTQKMVDGAVVQPWHCQPFVDGSTYGLELVYQHEQECHIVNDGPAVRIEWDFYKEPGGEVTGGEFVTFSPKAASQQYLFSTRIDIVAPPGYVARIEPHPRFFTDTTGTVPAAIIANVETQWWTKWFFVVFKVPPPGQRHIFRKGEPFAQVIFVPQRVKYELVRMTPEEDTARRLAAQRVEVARNEIGTSLWINSDGADQSNYYKVLSAAFARDGDDGVERVIKQAHERRQERLPTDQTPTAAAMAQAAAEMAQHRYAEARQIYDTVLAREPDNADAIANYGICLCCLGSTMPGLRTIARSITLEPRNPVRHHTFARMFHLLGRLAEAETAYRNCLAIDPRNPTVISDLSQVVAGQKRFDEALQLADRVLALAPDSAVGHVRKALIFEQAKRPDEARACVETALNLDPNLAEANAALARLTKSDQQQQRSTDK
jgi:tetratricopeptide (TPR) repeat protein